MDIALIEHRRGRANKYGWTPFPSSSPNFNSQWWDHPAASYEDPWFIQAMLGQEEVARIQLDDEVSFDEYVNSPGLQRRALEIQFLEVSAVHRRRGIGTEVINRLVMEHGERTLVAFSEKADEFWSSLGWERFDHPDGWPLARPLFVQSTEAVRPNRR